MDNNKFNTDRKITLNNGMQIPCIGFGTYQIRKKSELENSVKEAYKIGYRLFDTAVMYGNEKFIGDTLKKHKIPRKDIYLTTKILPADMTYEKTKKSIESSIKKLQCDYLDMVLIHWPEVDETSDRIRVWQALEESVTEGKVKMIGVSNFCKIHLEHILKNCKIKPVINQIECNPIYWDKETIDYSVKNGIVIEAYCPLAEWSPQLVQNKTIVDLAKKKNKTVPQIILKWIMQKNIIPLPKSVHTEYIKENFNLNGFCLTDEEMKNVDALNSINYKVDWDPHGVPL
jgi:diketogulonate reductase-like aldo/keto reductase